MDTIHLIGSEDVRTAGCNISSAAHNFYRAASNFEGAVDSLRRCLDEHASRIEAAIVAPMKSADSPATVNQQRQQEIVAVCSYIEQTREDGVDPVHILNHVYGTLRQLLA